jgi:hypothetical protein
MNNIHREILFYMGRGIVLVLRSTYSHYSKYIQYILQVNIFGLGSRSSWWDRVCTPVRFPYCTLIRVLCYFRCASAKISLSLGRYALYVKIVRPWWWWIIWMMAKQTLLILHCQFILWRFIWDLRVARIYIYPLLLSTILCNHGWYVLISFVRSLKWINEIT